MKLLLDQGLPRAAVRHLAERDIVAEHVGDLGMATRVARTLLRNLVCHRRRALTEKCPCCFSNKRYREVKPSRSSCGYATQRVANSKSAGGTDTSPQFGLPSSASLNGEVSVLRQQQEVSGG